MSTTLEQVMPYFWVLFVIIIAAIKLRSTWQPVVKKASGAMPQNAGQLTQIALAVVAITTLIYLFFQFTFAKNVLLGIVLMVIGYKLGKVKAKSSIRWIWPSLLVRAGWAVLGAAVLTSGYTSKVVAVADNSEKSVSCETDPSQDRCETWRKKKAEEKATAAEKARLTAILAAQSRAYTPPPAKPTHPAGALLKVQVPACGGDGDWSKVIQIEGGWQVKPAWNDPALHRKIVDGKTGKERVGNGDAVGVRYCTPVKTFAGDTMSLSWSPYKQ